MTIIEPPKEVERPGGEEPPAALSFDPEPDDLIDLDDEFGDEFEEALRRQLMRDGTIVDG